MNIKILIKKNSKTIKEKETKRETKDDINDIYFLKTLD